MVKKENQSQQLLRLLVFLITGAIGGGATMEREIKAGTGGNNNSVAWGQGSSVDNDSVAVGR